MTHPEWILVPWAVFAVALAFKVLKFGKALKLHLYAPTPSTDQFRQSLERIWAQEQLKRQKSIECSSKLRSKSCNKRITTKTHSQRG